MRTIKKGKPRAGEMTALIKVLGAKTEPKFDPWDLQSRREHLTPERSPVLLHACHSEVPT